MKKNHSHERRVDKTPDDHQKIEEHPIALDVQGLNKFYGSSAARKDILKNVSLQVKMGRVCCLLGPNGSGKTTLLKILAGLLDPNSGNVMINGIDRMKNPREAKAQIGWMPAEERSGLYGRITGRENLMFFGTLQGLDNATMDRAIGNLALQIGIDDELDQTVLKVSSGAKQKIGLARVMLHSPSVLLLDEPIRNLDPQTTLRFRRLIKDHITRIQHKTVILSTHLLEEARRVADMIVIVRKGEIIRVIEGLDLENELQTSTLEDIYLKAMAEEKNTHMIARVFFSFLIRDVRQQLSYKFSFVLDIASILFTATTFFFVSRLFEGVSGTLFHNYTNGYFGFVLVGIAFSNYQSVGLNSFAQSLRQEQYVGTLESVLATPVHISTFLAGSALWDFIYATAEVIIYFAVAIVTFGLSLANANAGAALLAVLLTLSTFMGLGVLSAAFILKFKKGNPVTWLIASAGELFGGVYFPTDILPDWMKSVSQWVPMTHALSALRKSLLSNAGVDVIGADLLYLLLFTVVIWPVGVLAFRWALTKSQQDGTLGHY